MEFESTSVFDKDVKKLDRNERRQLKAVLEKISLQPDSGKPLHHYANVFSRRVCERRLVYQYKSGEKRILLLLYKNRDEAHEELKSIG